MLRLNRVTITLHIVGQKCNLQIKTPRFQQSAVSTRYLHVTPHSRSPRNLLHTEVITGREMGKTKLQKNDGAKLKHLTYKEKLGGKFPVPGTVEVQVISTGRMGTPRAVMISTEHLKYLFNCGEGTQRLAMEHKMKVSRVENIFITHKSWDNVGGMLGMCLSLEGTCKVPKVTIHGPPNVEQFLTMSRRFARLHSIQVEKSEVASECYEDFAMKIEYVPLYPSVEEDEPAAKKPRTENTVKGEDMSVVYVCKPVPKPRAVSLARCAGLNIKMGPHIGELVDGNEVTLEDGRLIKPDDILEPHLSNRSIVVIECPTMAYLESLSKSEKLLNLHKEQEGVAIVVHFTPSHIMNQPEYQTWIQRLGSDVKHFLVNDQGTDVAFLKTYYSQAVLNTLQEKIFPLLSQQQEDYKEEENVNLEIVKADSNFIRGDTNLQYIYRGPAKVTDPINSEQCFSLNNSDFIAQSLEISDYTQELEALKQLQADMDQNQDEEKGHYPEVTFLGTGSAIPNKARNVSSILVRTSKKVYILLDCGENSYGQLLRHFGEEKTAKIMKHLKAVFVSHLHADHHLGLVGFLMGRASLLGNDVDPVLLLAPGVIGNWLHNVDQQIQSIKRKYRLVPLEALYKFNVSWFPHDGIAQEEDIKQDVLELLNLKEFDPIRVIHAQYPHGLVLTTDTGYKLVYSGDTRPCDDLVKAGSGCDLLIHEASMEDDLAADAYNKKHSTTSQAIEIGQKMKAKFTLLTHFSQRYAKIPIFSDSFHANVGIAFDHMTVTPALTPYLPSLLPTLKKVFAEDYAEMEEKQARRKMRRDQDAQIQKQKDKEIADRKTDIDSSLKKEILDTLNPKEGGSKGEKVEAVNCT